MRIDAFLIALVISTLFLVGGINIFQEQQTAYDFTADNVLFENITRSTDSITANVTKLSNGIIDNPVSDEDTENNLFKGGYNYLIGSWSLFKPAGELIFALSKAFGIPAFIVSSMLAILAIAAAAFLLYLVFRFKPTD